MSQTVRPLVLGVYPSIEAHPVDRLLHAGVRVSLNTDDPSLLSTSLPREYAIAREAFGWNDEIVRQVASTSIEASFASSDVKQALKSRLRSWPAS